MTLISGVSGQMTQPAQLSPVANCQGGGGGGGGSRLKEAGVMIRSTRNKKYMHVRNYQAMQKAGMGI